MDVTHPSRATWRSAASRIELRGSSNSGSSSAAGAPCGCAPAEPAGLPGAAAASAAEEDEAVENARVEKMAEGGGDELCAAAAAAQRAAGAARGQSHAAVRTATRATEEEEARMLRVARRKEMGKSFCARLFTHICFVRYARPAPPPPCYAGLSSWRHAARADARWARGSRRR